MLVDTHCHLDFPPFDPDRDEVIKRATDSGISCIINVGSTIESSLASVSLAESYPQVFAAVGIHPHDADSFNSETEEKLKGLVKQKKVVAVGETGLDYYRNLSGKDSQRLVFKKQIILAKEYGLPLVIHSRQAQEEVLEILKSFMPVKAVIHCFSGDENFLKECLALGFFISFTCNITFGFGYKEAKPRLSASKKFQDLRDMVKLAPLDRIMLETDCPYLSPEGFRGKRNEPFQVRLLAEEISRIKGVSFEEIADKTTQNAKTLFKFETVSRLIGK